MSEIGYQMGLGLGGDTECHQLDHQRTSRLDETKVIVGSKQTVPDTI